MLADGRYSRWLIPSTIPGASQLFKTLLTWGDNPVKAAIDHVLRGRGRQQGYIQGLKGSVNVSTVRDQNERAPGFCVLDLKSVMKWKVIE